MSSKSAESDKTNSLKIQKKKSRKIVFSYSDYESSSIDKNESMEYLSPSSCNNDTEYQQESNHLLHMQQLNNTSANPIRKNNESRKSSCKLLNNHNFPKSNLLLNSGTRRQMKRQRKFFTISEKILVNKLPKTVYNIKKKICSVFGGKKINFTLTNSDNLVINHTIDIKQGSTQFHTNQTYFIQFSDEMIFFSMKQNDFMGNKYLSIKYSVDKDPIKHKLCQIVFHASIPGISNQILNIPPKLNSKGKPILPFGKRQVLPSVKNMIFVDQNETGKHAIISIMKVSKFDLCIESVSIIPEEMIFMIGISSFLNHSS